MGRLIIELLASHGKSVERRYIFEKGHAAIGRSYKNDVILDDPFLSPEHLFISVSDGSVQVTDLKSENGTKINGRAAIKDQTEKAASGDQITIGRTKLKIILPGQPVAPALSVDRFTTFLQSLGRWRVVIIFTLFAFGLDAWFSYLESPGDRFWDKKFTGLLYAYIGGACLYVGVVGGIIYAKTRKAYYKSHLAVFNAGMILTLAYSIFKPFIFFWFFNNGLALALGAVASFAIMLAMFWASVRVSSDSMQRKDIAKLAFIALIFTVMTTWSAPGRGQFSSKPSYPAMMAPWFQPLTQPLPVDAFLDESRGKLFSQDD